MVDGGSAEVGAKKLKTAHGVLRRRPIGRFAALFAENRAGGATRGE